MSNQIIKRTYYAINIKLKSPLNISNGEDYYTDADVLKNAAGEYFVPGTSLAGAFRYYLGKEKNQKCIYGYSDGSDGQMSSIFISDMYLRDTVISVRDRVKLTDRKNVDNKFDVQIIEAGAKGTLFLEYVEREKDRYDFENTISDLLYAIQSGDVRIGADKNRGFGLLEIIGVTCRSFTSNDLDAWEVFVSRSHSLNEYPNSKKYSEWAKLYTKPESKYVTITVPLELKGGISIRKYSARKDRPDYEHITSGDKPIIPGTSWNGALRSDAAKILRSLGCRKVNMIMDQWFGFVREGEKDAKDRATQSMIVVGESVLENSQGLTVNRNKIDRFTGGTVTGALYSEYAYFGGETTLVLKIRKDTQKQFEAAIGLLMLVLLDLQKGYISVGGQGAVGRGIFTLKEGKNWLLSEDQEGFEKGRYLKALYRLIKKGGKEE